MIKNDSIGKGYKSIEAYSNKGKFSKFLHRLIFTPTNKIANQRSNESKKLSDQYSLFQGKIVREVTVESLDPFGYSLSDSLKNPRNIAEKSGNFLHIKSKEFNIKNLILIKKNKPFDSIRIKESERLIRSQRFTRRIQITSKIVGTNKDSVDVNIRVLDSWSLVPSGFFTPNQYNLNFNERNFLGWGHSFRNNIKKDRNSKKTLWSGSYTIPTIKNSFIKSTFFYNQDLNQNLNKGINIDRKFFSPVTKYAGGILIQQDFKNDSLRNNEQQFEKTFLKFNTHDFWFGFAIPLENKYRDDNPSNFVLKYRYMNVKYQKTAPARLDSIGFFQSENFLLGSIGFNSRKYYQDKFVFNYDIVEDIPLGKTLNFIYGYQRKNHQGRLYLGGILGYGNYFTWGYINTQFEYGTFLQNRRSEQGAYVFKTNYFTHLLLTDSYWSFRFFANASLFLGHNRLPFFKDQLTLNESSDGISGFRNTFLYGTKKIVLRMQVQSYSPWNVAGFRLNPFLGYNLGILGNETDKFKNSKAFSKISLGLLINNDFLIFGNFQISFSYYTSFPGVGDNVFGTNSFNTEDFEIRDFEIGKPQIVDYQ